MSRYKVVLLASLLGFLLAVITTWPLIQQLDTHLPERGPEVRVGDPYLLAWEIAWEGHALRTDPGDFLDANYFYPLKNSLAFLDAVHGYAPAGLIGAGAETALVRYNILYLLALTLAFLGPFLLARELGLRPIAAALVGVAAAYAPWRIDHAGQLLVISSGGIALALFMMARGYRTSRASWVVGGWCVAAWQLSLGFTLGLQFVYLLGALGFMAAVWFLRPRGPDIPINVVWATVFGTFLLGAVAIFQAIPFLEVTKDHPEAVRALSEVEMYSPPFRSFFTAAENNTLWGDSSAVLRSTLPWASEQTLFPGLIVLVLGRLGLGYRKSPLALRIGLGIGIVVLVCFALGLRGPQDGFLYRFMFDHAPGWQAIRTPGRLMTLVTLFLALLAGFGLQRLMEVTEQRWPRWKRALAPCLASILIGGVFLEGFGPPEIIEVPPVPEAQLAAADPIVHVPSGEFTDRLYTFWSTEGFPDMFNGVGAFDPAPFVPLRDLVNTFPDPGAVDAMRNIGVRTVIVHLDLLEDPAGWQASAGNLAGEAGLQGEQIGSSILYRLDDDPASGR